AGRGELARQRGDIREKLERVVGVSEKKPEGVIRRDSLPIRLGEARSDPQAKAVLERAAALREMSRETFQGDQDKKIRGLENILNDRPPDVGAAKADLRKLRAAVPLLTAPGDLPA